MPQAGESMRANYVQGVEQYYQATGTAYRNPHQPAIEKVIARFLDQFWLRLHGPDLLRCLDLACGSGEVTEAILKWRQSRWPDVVGEAPDVHKNIVVRPAKRSRHPVMELQKPLIAISATDPFTSEAYASKIGQTALHWSFADVASGMLEDQFDLVICSFAMHLVETTSELWALIDALSRQTRFLVVVSPHKLPHIKEGWNFARVDSAAPLGSEAKEAEILQDRVHLRLYRSTVTES